jgi:hypothetical protein
VYVDEMGVIESTLIKNAKMMGEPIPDRILNAPRLMCGLEVFYNAFTDLNSTRSHGFGPTPISWVDIKDYAYFYGFDPMLTSDLLYHIRRMDNKHLERVAAKQKAKN